MVAYDSISQVPWFSVQVPTKDTKISHFSRVTYHLRRFESLYNSMGTVFVIFSIVLRVKLKKIESRASYYSLGWKLPKK